MENNSLPSGVSGHWQSPAFPSSLRALAAEHPVRLWSRVLLEVSTLVLFSRCINDIN